MHLGVELISLKSNFKVFVVYVLVYIGDVCVWVGGGGGGGGVKPHFFY